MVLCGCSPKPQCPEPRDDCGGRGRGASALGSTPSATLQLAREGAREGETLGVPSPRRKSVGNALSRSRGADGSVLGQLRLSLTISFSVTSNRLRFAGVGGLGGVGPVQAQTRVHGVRGRILTHLPRTRIPKVAGREVSQGGGESGEGRRRKGTKAQYEQHVYFSRCSLPLL